MGTFLPFFTSDQDGTKLILQVWSSGNFRSRLVMAFAGTNLHRHNFVPRGAEHRLLPVGIFRLGEASLPVLPLGKVQKQPRSGPCLRR